MDTLSIGSTITIYIKGYGRKTGKVISSEGFDLEKNCTHLLETSRGNRWSFRESEVVYFTK